jgi:hypothetical protein
VRRAARVERKRNPGPTRASNRSVDILDRLFPDFAALNPRYILLPAAGLPNIGRNFHDSVTWKTTKGGSLLCNDLVALHRVLA